MRRPTMVATALASAALLGVSLASTSSAGGDGQVKHKGEDGQMYCVLDNGASKPCDQIGCGKRGDKPCKRIIPRDSTFTLKSALDGFNERLWNNEVPLKVTLPRADFKYQVSLNDDDGIYTVDGHKATDCECWDRWWYYCYTEDVYQEVICEWVNQYVDLRFALSESEAVDIDSPVEYFRTSGGTNKGEQWRFDFRYQFDVLYGGQLVVYPITDIQVPSLYAALSGNPVKIEMKCHVAYKDEDVTGYMMVQFQPTPFSQGFDDLENFLELSNYKYREGVRFNFPALPSLTLPPAVNTSSGVFPNGEECLNCGDVKNTYVVLAVEGGNVVKKGVTCTGKETHYWGEDGWWYDSFVGADGLVYRTTRLFYTDDSQKLISSVYRAEWAPQLQEILTGRILRQTVTCNNMAATVDQYLFFTIDGNQTDCGYVGGDMFCISAGEGLRAGILLPLLATLVAFAGAWGLSA